MPTLAPVKASEIQKVEVIKAKLTKEERQEKLHARDRAGYLSSALTKSPRAWDNAEAWSLLGAEYELSDRQHRISQQRSQNSVNGKQSGQYYCNPADCQSQNGIKPQPPSIN